MRFFPLFCIVFCIISAGIQAQPAATLLKDLNTSLSSFDEGSQPAELTILGNRLYFTARSSNSGFALFATDGTSGGTAMVRELYNLYPSGDLRPSELTAFNGKLYFASKTPDYVSPELWVSDGTATGTRVLSDNGPFKPRYLHVLNGNLLFMAGDDGNQALWRTDGTSPGTDLVKDFGFNPYQSDDEPDAYCVAGNLMYFEMLGGQLWRTDGTATGTQLINDFAPSGNDYADLDGFVEYGGSMYFLVQTVQDRIELWKTDGSTASHVKTLLDSGASSSPFYVSTAVTNNRFAIAISTLGIFNYALWISDGTEAGTQKLTNETVSAEPWQNRPRLVGQNNYFYYASGNQLRRTDGTPAGTEAVFTASGDDPVWNLMVHNGALYFTTGEYSPAILLWKTAGNPGDAIDVGLLDGYAFGPHNDWVSFNGSLFFCSDNPYYNSEIWKSEGANGEPQMLTELSLPIGSSDPIGYRDAGGRCYFQARPGDKPHHLWRTDGDAASTFLLDSLHFAYEFQAAGPDKAVYTDLNTFWHTTGQPGTSQAFLLPGGAQPISSGNPKILAQMSNGVWLAKGYPPGMHQTLMTLDPLTHTANVLLSNDALPDPIQFYGELDGRMLFTAPDPAQSGDIFLWATDGSSQGTQSIVWRSWNLNSSEPFASAINGKLVFGASSGAWVTDGTAAGTQPLVTITTGGYASLFYFTPFGGDLYFVMTEMVDGKPKDRLWRTDGTPSGTFAVLGTGSPIQGIHSLRATNGFLFFSAKDEQHGWELWRTDGTESGTALVTDFWPGVHSSWPAPVLGYQQYLFFMGHQPETGNELWITDGTEAGTRLVQDICPGPCSSWPFTGGLSAGRFVFSAYHPDYGREPWILDPAVVPAGEPGGSDQQVLDAWLSPNPAAAISTLFLHSDQPARIELRLFDALGRVAASWHHTIASGQQSFDLPLSGLPAGLYALHLDAGRAGARVLRLVVHPEK